MSIEGRYFDCIPILIEALKRISLGSDEDSRKTAAKAIRDWDKARGTEKWEVTEIPIPEGGVTQKAKHKNPEKRNEVKNKKFDRVAYQREYMRKRMARK